MSDPTWFFNIMIVIYLAGFAVNALILVFSTFPLTVKRTRGYIALALCEYVFFLYWMGQVKGGLGL